jgi:hypothetical protein
VRRQLQVPLVRLHQQLLQPLQDANQQQGDETSCWDERAATFAYVCANIEKDRNEQQRIGWREIEQNVRMSKKGAKRA